MRSRRTLASWSLASALGLLGATARAEPTAAETQAREHFDQGVEAIRHAEFAKAAQEFEAAQALQPNPVVLFNLGQAYSALGRAVEAENALRSYLETAPRPLAPEREHQVQTLIELNARRIGSVSVELVPPTASLEVDGSPIAKYRPLDPLRLAAGRHVLLATAVNLKPRIQAVDVQAGERLHVRLELEPLPAPNAVAVAAPPSVAAPERPAPVPPVAESAPAKRHETSTLGVVGLVITGVGGVALVMGGIFALEANRLTKESNRDGHCDANGCDTEGLTLRATAVRNGNWATGLVISGAFAAAAGITLYLVDRHVERSAKRSTLRLVAFEANSHFTGLTLGADF